MKFGRTPVLYLSMSNGSSKIFEFSDASINTELISGCVDALRLVCREIFRGEFVQFSTNRYVLSIEEGECGCAIAVSKDEDGGKAAHAVYTAGKQVLEKNISAVVSLEKSGFSLDGCLSRLEDSEHKAVLKK